MAVTEPPGANIDVPFVGRENAGGIAGASTKGEVSRPHPLEWPARMGLAVQRAFLAGVICAVIDCLWAQLSFKGSPSPGFLSLTRFEVGLVAPLALCFGGLFGALAIVGERPRRVDSLPFFRTAKGRLAGLLVPPLLLLGFTYQTAVELGAHPDVAYAIERGAPIGGLSLTILRRLTDRDHDGHSSLFGDGDCNDRDPRISSTAADIPGNGIDEDCSGEDSPAVAPTRPAVAPTRIDADPIAKYTDLLPKDLNVILVTIDTLRADIGYAGYPKPVSPNLDALAARSVVFDRAYSLASYTSKSLAPLLIGKYPSETHRDWAHFNHYSSDDIFVSERLQKAGVHTISVQAHWFMAGSFGLSRGFDVVDGRAQPNDGGDQDNDDTVTGGRLTDAAIKVLSSSENTSARFFAWVHYLDPHGLYARHPEAPDFGSGMRAAYDGEVWYTDREVGRLLDFVAAQPWGATTAIVVTSDHGEAFGEHQLFGHSRALWEELVRVPLLVYVPGLKAHRIEQPRSAIDLAPTILDLFQVSAEISVSASDFLSGKSLAADLAMPDGYEPEARDIFVDMPAGPFNDDRRAFLHANKKLYVFDRRRFALFDLENDPAEKSDLSGDPVLMSEMKADYDAKNAALREVRVKPVPKQPPSP